MSWIDKLKAAVTADDASDGDLDRPDLVRQVSRGILALRRRGPTGVEELPPGVRVTVEVAGGSLELLRGWVADPAFEREIDARLLNDLARPGELPARRYVVVEAERTAVRIDEDAAPTFCVLVIEGGDRHGDRYPVGPGRREWRMGRGRWHTDNRLPNDVILTEDARWVSRAAAVLRRTGSLFEVEAREQGEFVVVVPADGSPQRPAMTASRKVPVGIGDRVEFHDGRDAHITLVVRPLEGT